MSNYIKGNTSNSFLAENFNIEGTEVVVKDPMYPDVANKSMYVMISEQFDLVKFANDNNLRLIKDYRFDYNGEMPFVAYKGFLNNYTVNITIEYLNELPKMITLSSFYNWG